MQATREPGTYVHLQKDGGGGGDRRYWCLQHACLAVCDGGTQKPVRVSAITEDYISQQDPRFRGIMDVEEFRCGVGAV